MKASLLAGLGFLVWVVPLPAHHSFAAEYDRNKPVTLSGTVTKVEWMNPHAYFYIDVKDPNGAVTNWGLENGNALERRGWTRHAVKEGDQVTIDGYLAKDGAKWTKSIRGIVRR